MAKSGFDHQIHACTSGAVFPPLTGQRPDQQDPDGICGNPGRVELDGRPLQGEGEGEGEVAKRRRRALALSPPRQLLLTMRAPMQALAIKEHIGYPDHILQEGNPKLDQEYAHVGTR